MKGRLLSAVGAGVLLVFSSLAAGNDCGIAEPVLAENLFPQVKLATTQGDIVIELDRRRAPITANNFLRYVLAGGYRDTIFHRVIADFVVQGGGYQGDLSEVDTFDPIYNESGNGLDNEARTVAMARHDDPHSADSQFYFNLGDNDSLNPSRRNWGYAVFGTVVEGWEVVEAIGGAATGYSNQLEAADVPVAPIILKDATVLEPAY